MASVLGRQAQCLEVLLRRGASVTQVDKQGNTIYHLAIISCPLVITVSRHYFLFFIFIDLLLV